MPPFHRRLRLWALVAAPAFPLLNPPAAIASDAEVAVAVTLRGEATGTRIDPVAARARLADRIARTLRSDFAVAAVDGCDETEQPCALARARAKHSDWLVEAVLVTEGADQRLRFAVRSVPTGEVVVAFEDVCELCGRAELDGFFDAMAGALAGELRALEPGTTQLTIVGLPDRAGVWLDGRRVGTLPWRGEVEPGEHELRVETRGYLSAKRQIDVVPGTHERVEVKLDRDPAATSRRLKIAGWTLLGAGAATTAGGAVLWAMDGRPHRDSCSMPDARGQCPNVYESRAGGIALTAVGLGTMVVGGTILVCERVRFDRTRWRAGVQPGWRRASIQVWF